MEPQLKHGKVLTNTTRELHGALDPIHTRFRKKLLARHVSTNFHYWKACVQRAIDRKWEIPALFLLLRVLTSIVALVPSMFPRNGTFGKSEHSPLEVMIQVWPPSHPLALWIERIAVAPWQRWDAKYFVAAVGRGFSTADGSASFHPLLVWLSAPINYVTGSPLFALLSIATLSTLCLYFAFQELARLDLPNDIARRATLLFALYPFSYVFYAPYTESTFLLYAVLFFLFARRRRWLLAGLCGAAATLARQQGLFLIIPLMWELWASKERRPGALASIPLIAFAYLFWILYRTFALADSAPDVSTLQGLIYSVLISSSSRKVIAEQAFLFPPYAFYLALVKLWQEPNLAILLDLTLGVFFAAISIAAWRNLRTSYRLYVLTILLLSFSYNTGMIYSSTYMGLPRHLLLAFPIFIGLAPRLSDYASSKLYKVGFFGLLLLTFFHCIGVWVP